MNIKQIRTFVPSKDYKYSQEYYKDLGFEILWEGDDLTQFGIKGQNFFLQKYYVEEWANNCMMQMLVDDLDVLYEKAEELVKKYPSTKIKPIFTADYGRTFHILDPTGVLWHMTEVTKEVEDESKLICEDN